MMTLLDDLRLALRQICVAIGLPGTAATVVPLVVLGIALNFAALSAMESMNNEKHPCHSHNRLALRSAARTEMKVVRAVLTSTLKKIGDGQRRWCLARQCGMDRQTGVTECHIGAGFVWAAPSSSDGCDVKLVGRPNWKAAIALVQC
jgi:hypothetical protein